MRAPTELSGENVMLAFDEELFVERCICFGCLFCNVFCCMLLFPEFFILTTASFFVRDGDEDDAELIFAEWLALFSFVFMVVVKMISVSFLMPPL